MAATFDADDPRITGDYVRTISSETGDDVILIGVVHDHPASKHRVRTVIESVEPDILALELPPLAIPLFERYARPTHAREVAGEMSCAIRAAETDHVVGIDGPTPAFLNKLLGNLYRNDANLGTIRHVLRGIVSVTRDTVACRIGARFGVPTTIGSVDSSPGYNCDRADSPDRQAADERSHIDRADSMKHVFGESVAVQIRDRTRETHMGDRLEDLRSEGTVVTVVGIDHLDAVAEQVRQT